MGTMSLPPGFRFHPTDDELVGYYLKRKVEGLTIELEVIPVIDLYKCEPWELPEKSFLPKRDMEWFFFCPRDRKYPNGSRTNRATGTGYWKATGKDRKVTCESSVYGLRKTLVFYRGRAPGGERTEWVMHEYRLCEDFAQASPNFLGAFALCRVAKRNEQAQKNNDLQGEPKAKRSHTHMLEKSNSSSLTENAMGIGMEPISMNIDHTNFWLTNVHSDTQKIIQPEDEPFVSALTNSASASSLYSNLTVEDYLADDINMASPLDGMGIYHTEQFSEPQTLDWDPPQFFIPQNNGADTWNPMLPTICRQSSEGEETNFWLQAWGL